MTVVCDHCDGAVTQEDSYEHDGRTVEIYTCPACEREGALVHHPDGHTSGRGILAEQADERIHTLSDARHAVGRFLTSVTEGWR